MNGYNPMIDYQRNQLLAQQAMIQQQLAQLGQTSVPQARYTPNPEPPSPQYFVREVTNFDDVKRVPPEPCATYLFPDTTTGKIYMKRLNADTGRSEYYSYVLENDATQDADPMQQLNARLERIEMILGGMNVQSISENTADTADGTKSARNGAATDVAEDAETKSEHVPAGANDDKRKR